MKWCLEKPWNLMLYIKLTTSWNFGIVKKKIDSETETPSLQWTNKASSWLCMFCLISKSNKELKYRIQTTQNNCMRFCLQLDKLKHISHVEFERLNWLPMTCRFKQWANSLVFNYFNEQYPNYLNKVFDVTTERNFKFSSSFQKKLKCQFWKTINGYYTLYYIGLTFWNQNPHTLKCSNDVNTFKELQGT